MTEYGPTHNRKAPPGWTLNVDGQSYVCGRHTKEWAAERLAESMKSWEAARHEDANRAYNRARDSFFIRKPKPTIQAFMKTKVLK